MSEWKDWSYDRDWNRASCLMHELGRSLREAWDDGAPVKAAATPSLSGAKYFARRSWCQGRVRAASGPSSVAGPAGLLGIAARFGVGGAGALEAWIQILVRVAACGAGEVGEAVKLDRG